MAYENAYFPSETVKSQKLCMQIFSILLAENLQIHKVKNVNQNIPRRNKDE